MSETTQIRIADRSNVFGGEGTKRRASWDALRSLKGKKTVARYLAAGGARKYLSRWEKAGLIAAA